MADEMHIDMNTLKRVRYELRTHNNPEAMPHGDSTMGVYDTPEEAEAARADEWEAFKASEQYDTREPRYLNRIIVPVYDDGTVAI